MTVFLCGVALFVVAFFLGAFVMWYHFTKTGQYTKSEILRERVKYGPDILYMNVHVPLPMDVLQDVLNNAEKQGHVVAVARNAKFEKKEEEK